MKITHINQIKASLFTEDNQLNTYTNSKGGCQWIKLRKIRGDRTYIIETSNSKTLQFKSEFYPTLKIAKKNLVPCGHENI
jgi:hypothetical protein